jgi:uncharacterized protein YecT (DUF1311 family)
MKTLVLILAFLGTSAYAADINQIEKTFKECSDKAGSTMEMNICNNEAYSDADTELNAVYGYIRGGLESALKKDPKDEYSKETLRRLVAAQRSWITFRDADCSYAGTTMLGGSGEGVMIGGCLATMTIDRVKRLNDLK